VTGASGNLFLTRVFRFLASRRSQRLALRKQAAELRQANHDIDQARDVMDLMVILLTICRRHATEVMAVGQDREKRRQIRQEVARVKKAVGPAFTSVGLSPTTRAIAKATLNEATDFAVAARALALGIDEARKKHDPKAYVKRCAKWPYRRELSEGDPYPTPSFDLTKMYGGRGFSRRPRRTAATAFDRVDGLALWPSAESQPLSVIYDTDAGAYLDNALAGRESITILAVLPNGRFEEFRTGGTMTAFFGMHPWDTVVQNASIDRGLRKANAMDVDIVVTPELSSTCDTVTNIRTALAGFSQGGPRVVIAGGLHVRPGPSEQRNRMSTIYADPNSPVFEHDKIGEFFADPWDEDIDRSTTMTIHAGINWSMIPLICADLLDDAVVDAVADLCPQLVIVPCMSDKTGDFEMSMGTVIRKTQATQMVVNGPQDWPLFAPPNARITPPAVVVGMPLAASWITRVSPPSSSPLPFGVIFCSNLRTVNYIPL